MRIEFVYAPGCSTYKKALDVLQTVIAEERLPIAIEMIEDGHNKKPIVRINGAELGEPSATFEGDPCFFNASSHLLEHMRSSISQYWHEHAVPA